MNIIIISINLQAFLLGCLFYFPNYEENIYFNPVH